MMEELIELFELKREKRAHSKIYGVEQPESVAGHSWGTAFLCMIYGEEADVDTDKAVKMALIHDLAEAETGDIPNRADEENLTMSREEKARKEEQVWRQIDSDIESDQLIELWKEYKQKQTDEAVFVKEMDLIELAIQALKNEKAQNYDTETTRDIDYEHLDEIFVSVDKQLRTELGRKLFGQIKSRYEDAKEG